MYTAILVLALALGSEAQSYEADKASSSEYLSGIAAGRIWEEDLAGGPDLDGYRIAVTTFNREPGPRA